MLAPTRKVFFMNNNYIGVFDSGLGGLTVVKSLIETMPNENIIYFGDIAHVPYGTRSKEQITEYVMQDVKFLQKFDIKAVVIACNTADSIARKKVEEVCPVPVFGVVKPAAKYAAESTKNNKIGVVATNATVNSGAYQKAIEKYNPAADVYAVACPLLVPLVEEGRFKRGDEVTEKVVSEYLEPLIKAGVDTLVLGCTHYPLLMDIISDIVPDVSIINSGETAARLVKQELEKHGIENKGNETPKRRYFVNDSKDEFEKHASLFMGRALETRVEQVEV